MLFLRRAAVAGAGAGARRFAGAGVEVGGRERLRRGPGLQEFLRAGQAAPGGEAPAPAPYLPAPRAHQRKVSLEVFGCQMNVSDTEVVWSILKDAGFQRAEGTDADVYLVMTCAIREGAETKIWKRLEHLRGIKNRRAQSKQRLNPVKIGILGCMAERLKEKLLEKEKSVDIVAGPDSYRDLPRLLELTDNNQTAVNVLLSLDETYADVVPVRLNQDCVTAFVSIMRGCDNMCTYCIVPFTRGRERSRPITSIVDEVKQLSEQGVREITLLGQNVNSYRDISQVTEPAETRVVDGFRTVYKKKKGGLRFADLLDKVSSVDPEMRIRFTSPHPKDFPDEVLHIISERSNICKMLHLPAQSGSSAVLERMRRGYTREAYLALVQHVRDILPGVGLSSDFICGFCGETDEQFEETLTLMDIVNYNVAYLFPYSMREKTTAHRRYDDDVSDATKRERHLHMNQLFRRKADILNRSEIGNTHLVLIEGNSKKSEQFLVGRNEHNIKVIVPQMEVEQIGNNFKRQMKPGDYVAVDITDANWLVMKGTPLFYSSISSFYNYNNEGRIRKTL